MRFMLQLASEYDRIILIRESNLEYPAVYIKYLSVNLYMYTLFSDNNAANRDCTTNTWT